MSSIFSNPKILNESPSIDDFLDYKDEITRVEKRMQAAVENSKSVIIAYLGAFGVGKSTILDNIQGKVSKEKWDWEKFETWRYANRNELWDAFVIKTVAEIKGKKESQVAKGIDGSVRPWSMLLWILGVFIGLTGISWVLYGVFGIDAGFWDAYLKYAAPVIVPILLLIGLGNFLNSLSYGEPLKRVFQLEDLLRDALSTLQKPLIIVIEDVDRANDDASIFMEALHEFIDKNNADFRHPVVVIAPQSNSAFDALDTDRKKHIEHSLKVYDEKMYFNAGIEHATVDAFYSKISFSKEYEKYKPTMIEVTKEIAYYYKKDQLTIRMLKHALREVDWFIQSYPDHNPSIALVYALARVLKDGDDLAVRRLTHSKNLDLHDPGNHQSIKFIIGPRSVFAACLAIAAGADKTGEAAGFLDSNGKFNQSSMYRNLDIALDKNDQAVTRDEVEEGGQNSDQYNSRRLRVYIRRTYVEQLTI